MTGTGYSHNSDGREKYSRVAPISLRKSCGRNKETPASDCVGVDPFAIEHQPLTSREG